MTATLMVLVVMVLMVSANASAVEIGTELVQGFGGSGRLTLSMTAGELMPLLELSAARVDGMWSLSADAYMRRYDGARWAGIGIGWRSGGLWIASALVGARMRVGDEAFIDPGFGMQYRSNGMILLTPKLYFSIAI